MKMLKFLMIFVIFSAFMISCSGSDGESENAGSDESPDIPGASVDAVSYQDTYPIELQVQMPSGEWVRAYDGQYLLPGKKRFAVYVRGDTADIDKVLISDGGTYQVKATAQGDSYQADFTIDDHRLYSSVLIQVVHKNKRASKEKIVFKTVKEKGGDQLIRDGIGILASNDLLKKSKDQLASALDQYIIEAFDCIKTSNAGLISELTYGDNNPETVDINVTEFEAVDDDAYPSAVIRLGFMVYDVNLGAAPVYGKDLIVTNDNDLKVEMTIAIDDQGKNGARGFVVRLVKPPTVYFKNDFFMRSMIQEKIASGLTIIEHAPFAADLEQLFKDISESLPLTLMVNDTNVDLISLFEKQDIDLSKYLFLDLYGIPEQTSSSTLVLGSGIFIADKNTVHGRLPDHPEAINPDFNKIIIDVCQQMADKAFESIKEQYNGLITTLSFGDDNPEIPDIAINMISIRDTDYPNRKSVRADFTIKDVDLTALTFLGFSLIYTRNNDLTVDAAFEMTYAEDASGKHLDLSVEEVVGASFKDYFLGQRVVEALAEDSFKNVENVSADIDKAVAEIVFNIDFTGCQPGLTFPDVPVVYSPYKWELKLPQGYNLRLAVSQDTINGMLDRLLVKDFEWDLYELLYPILGEDFVGFDKNKNNDQKTIMRFNVPPAIDLRSSQIKIEADDVLIEYQLRGEPQWQASVDLDLLCDVRVVNQELAFYFSSVPEKCHFHIMKDNAGNLGLLDHSNLVNDIVKQLPVMLGGFPNDPVFTIPLDSLEPFLVLNYFENPLSISALNGYLYFDADAASMDFSTLIKNFL